MYQVDLVLIRLPLNCIDWVGMYGQMSWSAVKYEEETTHVTR